MSITKLQKNELKKLLHQVIVIRDKKCLRCGSTKRLNASHIYSKGHHPNFEWDIDNVKCLCWACHMFWWHKDIRAANIWLQTKYPKMLKRIDNKVKKGYGKVMLKKIYDFKTIKSRLKRQLRYYEKKGTTRK